MLKGSLCLASALLALALTAVAARPARAQENQTPQGAGTQTRQQQPAGTSKHRPSSVQQPSPSPTPAPLTGGEKIERSFRLAFLRPTPYLLSAFSAGVTQLREDSQPQKDNADEVADWGSRTARSFATRATTTLFASGFYPALFKQDPRYERSRSKHVGERALHALSRVFVTRGDDGDLQPNYSRFAGAFTASALANVWERSTPGHDRIGTDATLRRFGRSFIWAGVGNLVFNEFGHDIVGIFRR